MDNFSKGIIKGCVVCCFLGIIGLCVLGWLCMFVWNKYLAPGFDWQKINFWIALVIAYVVLLIPGLFLLRYIRSKKKGLYKQHLKR